MRLDELFTLAADLGTNRHGVVRAPQLRLAGADPDTVARAIRSHWQVPVRGVYVPHKQPLTDAELAHVAVAHAGPDAVVSGALAARVHDLRWLPNDVVGVVALIPPETRRVHSEGIVLVRRCSRLATTETRSWEGVQLAPVAQVVADTCRQLLTTRRAKVHGRIQHQPGGWFETWCLRDIRGIVLGAVADGHCTATELRELVEAGAMRDSALIRRACVDASRGAASPPEAELVDGLLECGVLFTCNVELWDGEELVAVLDAYLIGTGVGAEVDSKEAHEAEDLLDATLLRHRRVSGYDLDLLHVTPARYRADPAQFHQDLFAAARDRLRRGLGDPPGLRLVPRGPLLRGPRVSPPPYRLPSARTVRAA
jgi:hypothetical protein